jgi:hypothetical protein
MPAQTVRSLKGSSVYRLARHFPQQINMHASSHFVIPWIQAESAVKAGRTEPTVKTAKNEPTERTAKTEPSIKAGSDGKTGQTGKPIKTERPLSPTGTIVMSQAEELAHAKRRAAISYSRMASSPGDDRATAQVNSDEMDVLNARINLLQTFLRQGHDAPPMCLPVENVKGPRVCVVYDRIRCEGELELGPMQSSMSWAVQGAEDTVMHLLSSDDNAGQTEVIRSLLAQVRASAPKKHCLAALQGTLEMHSPDHMVLKGTAGGQTRVLEGLGAGLQGCPTPPLFRVIWGALDLDVLEGWQNPSTNAAIRLSILDTAQQAAREARQTKAPLWANVAYMQIRVFHDDECHRLTLRPFSDSESCTVSHLQYSQSVFDDSGPERGILNLVADPSSIHPMPLGRILPMQAYVCLGAHRKNRLNEAQLNYVHAKGLLAHGFDTQLLPAQVPSMHSQGSSLPVKMSTQGSSLPAKMPHAKSTRVTGDKLDVLASSFHIADQVYTTITVVQYPPFGVQFETKQAGIAQAKSKLKAGGNDNDQNGKLNPDAEEWKHKDRKLDPSAKEWNQKDRKLDPSAKESKDENRGQDPSPEAWADAPRDGEHSGQDEPLVWNIGGREPPGEKRVKLAYKKTRNPGHPEPYTEGKKWAWNADLKIGEHYFVDGIIGSPFLLGHRMILFEIDNGTRYKEAQQKLGEIKHRLYHECHDVWDHNLCFYSNLQESSADSVIYYGPPGRPLLGYARIKQIWNEEWSSFLRENYKKLLDASTEDENGYQTAFWYCAEPSIWVQVFGPRNRELAENYVSFQNQHYDYWINKGRIQSKMLDPNGPCLASKPRLRHPQRQPSNARAQTLSRADQLPLPKTQMTARVKSDLTVAQLQSRVNALETRLRQSRQEENTQHLLEAVLEKLEATEV